MATAQGALTLMAQTIYGEARGESYLGQIAVGYVIKNRADKPGWWGHDIATVCLAPYQFSCWGDLNRKVIESATLADKAYLRAMGIAALVQTGDLIDPTEGSLYYHTIAAPRDAKQWPPKWTRDLTETTRIGHHVFYK